jgi:hypothetical protein
MQDALGGNPAVDQHLESPPVQAGLLTAQAELPPPEAKDPPPESPQGARVPRHRMVVEVALYDRPQPLARLCNGLVPTLAQLLLQRCQLRPHALARRLASDDTGAGLPMPCTDVCEAQKVERLRLAFSSWLPVRDGVWPKLDQARVVWMHFQAELPASSLPVPQEPRGILPVFEADHAIIRVADDSDIALGAFLAPGVHPQVEDLVEGDVGEERRSDRALRHSRRRLRPLTIL